MYRAEGSQPLAFEDHFSLSYHDFEKTLNIALSKGGEFAELYLEYKVYSYIHMEEDIIKETSESIGLGAGVRVIAGDQTGYGYVNDTAADKIKSAALTAAAIASGDKPANASAFIPQELSHNVYTVASPAHLGTLLEKIAIVKRAYTAAQEFSPAVQKVKVSLTDHIQYVTVVNSEGLIVSDARPLVRLTCVCLAEKGSRREAGFSGGGGRVGLEYFGDVLNPEQIGRASAEEAVQLCDSRDPPAGEMPVVLAPGHSGVLIHEAVGHLLEADFHRKKTSIFWDKMGQTVASEQVTIIDDPTIPGFRGSYNMDDEGIFPKKTHLIHRGRLVGLLQDRLSAKLMKASLTGHGRRQDYSTIPIPRMSNTYIDRGKYDPKEILGSVQRGLYAQKYQGGQVEDSGKFTFSVSSGFLIEGGNLTAPINQATLIGTNIDILRKIEMVGSDLEFGLQTGICGKEGQSVPVSDGCPTIKIQRMTVGGRQ